MPQTGHFCSSDCRAKEEGKLTDPRQGKGGGVVIFVQKDDLTLSQLCWASDVIMCCIVRLKMQHGENDM